MKQQRQAYTYALLAVLCWSTIGSAFKISLRYLDFLTLLLFASFVAVAVLFITLLLQGKLNLLKKIKKENLLNSAFLGLLNPFLYYVVLLKAYELLPAQEAGTLNYIWPLVLVLLSIPMLRQKITGWSIMAILVSFFGIILISTHGQLLTLHFSNPVGVFLALGSAIFWALYWIFNMKDPREEVSKLFLNFCFGFFYIFLTIAILRFLGLNWSRYPLLPWQGIAGSVYLGIFEMGITFILWMMALKLSSTTAKVSNLIYLSPFGSLILIHFLVGEVILLSTVIGLVFIVGGIIIQQYIKS
ncbi:MAG TPA: DMT family transporter [Bacteroidales bacterium]|nr:DMT family transporter [Bacteroidales bacterium]